MDRREYHRNYYYKRDPEKLRQYRKKHVQKVKEREYQRKKRLEYGMKPRVKKTIEDATTYGQRYYYLNKEKHSKWYHEWYLKNREKILDKLNTKYRNNKLKEFVDNVLNIHSDNN